MAECRKNEVEELVVPPAKKPRLESKLVKPPMQDGKSNDIGGHLTNQLSTQQNDHEDEQQGESSQEVIEITVNMISNNTPMKLSFSVKSLKNDGFSDDLVNLLKTIGQKEENISETELVTLIKSGVRRMSESKAFEDFIKCCRKMPTFKVKLLDDDKLVYLRVQHPSNSEAEWVSLHLETVEKVPFLKALCSDRWKTSDYQTITSVRAKSLRFLDFVYVSDENFEVASPFWSKSASLFIHSQLDLKSTIEDFHYLDIEFKLLNDLNSAVSDNVQLCKNIRTSFGSSGARTHHARIMVIAINLGLINTQSLKAKIRNHFYNAFYYIVSHGMFDGEIHNDVVSMYGKFKFTAGQLDQLERVDGGLPEPDHHEEYHYVSDTEPNLLYGEDYHDGDKTYPLTYGTYFL